MPKRKRWSFTAGKRPNTVTVEERVPGGVIRVRAWNPAAAGGKGGWFRKSLGHRDRDRAEAYALEQAAKLKLGSEVVEEGGAVTLGHVLAAYERHRTPRKTPREQKHDKRRSGLWGRFLGGKSDPHGIRLEHWEAFARQRASGEVDAEGHHVPADDQKSVGARTVQADLLWLKWVFNWAAEWRLPSGEPLMSKNPVRGFKVRGEKNPKRPVATADRYEAVRAKSDEVAMVGRWNGKRETVRSYLSEVLDLAQHTGRRIGAIRRLRFEDLRLARSPQTPFGAIRWPAATDKEGKEWEAPLSPQARAALDRIMSERPGVGRAYLFPKGSDPSKPVRYEQLRVWLLEAEELAEVESQKGSAFHAYRRGWATARKGLPVADVAKAGGWKSPQVVQDIYQQADDETTLQVVLHAAELREAK